MSKVGLVGFVAIALITYIFFYVPQELKNELTRKWLHLEGSGNIIGPFLVLIALITIIGQHFYYQSASKNKDKRIEELAEEKTKLQQAQIKKPLKSSKKQ